MGFAVSKFAAAGTKVGPTEEDDDVYQGHLGLIIGLSVGLIVLILIMLGIAFYCRTKKNKAEERNDQLNAIGVLDRSLTAEVYDS
jgi:hypothetical protein